MSKCKTVTLRKRKIKNGTQYSLCLDYYPGYRDNTTMKVITREALGIYIFAKPANQQERDFNARMMKKAEILRNRRYEAIFNENNGFFDKARMKGDFLAYFKELADRRNIKWQHVYKHFERFVNGKCTFEEVDVDLCRKFMEYLLNAPQTIHTNQKLHINSAAGYWSAFRAVLHTACILSLKLSIRSRMRGRGSEKSFPFRLPDGIAEERHQAAYLAADTAVYQRQDVRDHPYAEDEADCTQPHQ